MTPGDVTAPADRYAEFSARKFWLAAHAICTPREWFVLEARYIHDRSWVQIADELKLSERHIRRLCGDAQDKALKKMQEDS